MSQGRPEELAPSGEASTQRTEDSSSPTLGLLARLLLGGALLGHEAIRKIMAPTASGAKEPIRPLSDQPVRPLPGQPAAPTDSRDLPTGAPEPSPAFRHLLIGALFDTGQWIERQGTSALRLVSEASSPAVRWARRSRLTAPARHRFNALSDGGKARVQRWVERGVLEEQRSRALLNSAVTRAVNNSLDQVVDSPQVQGLVGEFVQAQGQGLGRRFLQELRALAVSGDCSAARLARRVLRHPKHEVPPFPRSVPAPPSEPTPAPDLRGRAAGFVSRLLAFMIDVIIVSILIRATGWMLEDIRMVTGWSPYLPATASAGGYMTPIYVTAGGGLLMSAVYFLFFWTVAGMTPGKGIMGLRIVRRDGSSLSFVRSLFRLLGYWVSTLLSGLGYVWIAIDNRREGWHDKIARTAVIYAWDARPSTRSLGSVIPAAEDRETENTAENPHPGY